MPEVILVRHAEPLADDRTPSDAWGLSAPGRDEARLLGRRLVDRWPEASVWTSPEAKARQTAALAFPGAAASVRDEIAEVRRPWYRAPEQLADAAARYLRGQSVDGWEPRAAVTARLSVLGERRTHPGPLVVVSHGLLLTVWLDHVVGLADPYGFWSDLRTPDAWAVDLDETVLQRVP